MMYHGEPNRSEPNRYRWYSVETPSVFREYRLPSCETDFTATHKRLMRELRHLAEAHGTYVHTSEYRRG